MNMMKPSKEDKDRDKRFQAESDLRTLVEAERIRKDKARSAAASIIATEQSAAVKGKPDGKE